jgi:chemotaxis protein methyltransferase CheR
MIFTEAKRYYVERRIWERMAATDSPTFGAYFARLRSNTEDEIQQFVNAFTINETYFYREDYQLKCLTNDLLTERVGRKHSGDTIRIWSAACATGEEAYSIAMWLLENWPSVDEYAIEIVGSDIDSRVLELARAGTFGKRALMRLPQELIGKYFDALPGECWQISPQLRDSVSFTAVNLVDPDQTSLHGQFDVLFCRNVLIYFDDASRRVAAENLYENLFPGGFICLGHTESMSRISPLFEVRRFADAIVYQRPEIPRS